MRFAILDLETTGGSPKIERITEIAILLYENGQVIDEFESLVNPERSIPPFITRITGINSEMLVDAPKFFEIARRIVEITEGATIVAHNARFDYGFLKHEFNRFGYTYSRKRLCTVQLSKRLLPELQKHNLDSLIDHFGVSIKRRHRAMDDTRATLEIFRQLQDMEHGFEAKKELINFGIKTAALPEAIDIDVLHNLPESTGVYFIEDSEAQVIYVGKSVNIKKRIFQHFQRINKKSEQMQYLTKTINFELTGSELISLLMESEFIKSMRPQLNKAQRNNKYPYSIVEYEEDGYLKFKTVKTSKAENRVLDAYSSQKAAKSKLAYVYREYFLCPAFCDLEKKSEEFCQAYYLGYCRGSCGFLEEASSYNSRARMASECIDNVFEEDFVILDEGRYSTEYSIVLVKDGFYRGYGYLSKDEPGIYQSIMNAIQPKSGHSESNRIIRNYLSKKSTEVQLIYLDQLNQDPI